MYNKHLMRLFFVLTFVFLSTSAYLLLPDSPKKVADKPIPQNITWSGVATDTVISDNKPTVSLSAKPTTVVETKKVTTEVSKTGLLPTTTSQLKPVDQEEIKKTINIIVDISDQQYQLQLPEKSTPYNAMQKLIVEKKISATIKEFSGMGYFVEEINGIKSDNQSGKYWIYYINGQSAKVGISSYTLKQNDLITWKYERSKF